MSGATRECKGFIIIYVIDVDSRKLWEYKGFRWGWGCMSPPKSFFFFLKMEGASGVQTPSEDSLELWLSQTGLAKK